MTFKMTQRHSAMLALLLGSALLFGSLVGLPFTTSVHATMSNAVVPQLEVFGTGVGRPQTLVPSASGDLYVVDTDRKVWSLPGQGGTGTLLATLGYSLRDGVFLTRHFKARAGQFLILGGVATTNTPALSSTMDDAMDVTQYASQESSLWSAAIVPTGFGAYTNGVLVVNQGSGRLLRDGSLDYFAPDGSIGRVADLPELSVPYGGSQVFGLGEFSGTALVTDARTGDIVSVNSQGLVQPFATIPLGAGQTGLRQIAQAPQGWGAYSRHVFVSIAAGEVAVLDKYGIVVAKITGFATPRGLRFVDIEGEPTLLVADTGSAGTTPRVWKAGPEDIVPLT